MKIHEYYGALHFADCNTNVSYWFIMMIIMINCYNQAIFTYSVNSYCLPCARHQWRYWRWREESSKILALKGLTGWSGETDTSEPIGRVPSMSAGIIAVEEIRQGCQGRSGKPSQRGWHLSQPQEVRDHAALGASKRWVRGTGTGVYKEGSYRCVWEAQGARCGWNRRELAGGRNWGQGAVLEEMGRGQTHGGPQATLGTHFDFAELGPLESWEGGGDPFPEVPCSKDAGEQESVEMSPSSEGGEVFLITIFGLSNLLQ